ncbi:adenylate/guanylate cyclase domain-containing protein [Alkalinema sp. FACHB-956]|uniref:CHASE2 domain-containing protein n=1 Tax=Alkalinema sp. FACHB-956 TaxID=2692768 RepID=UPI001681E613|nr:adenylate/guanylate cyclase domain-containing protein [Alkalinema sp. FACHB-956]MBD2325850.1 adenylate/guanylate cyclase domain-containing protein [Alkalinema sp. FACHB-956]
MGTLWKFGRSTLSQSSWKQRLWKWRGVLIAAPSVTGVVIAVRLTGLMQGLEWAAFDQYMRMRTPEPPDDRIVIVGIQESDLQKYGWPLPDDVLAKVLDRVRQQQPRAIGLDLYRDLPVGQGYAQLTKVFESTPNLVGIQKIGGTDPLGAVAPPPTLKKLGQVAANDVVMDSDGKLRRGLLFLEDREQNNVPTLSMAMAMFYLDREGIAPQATPDDRIQLGQALLTPVEANDGGYVRANAQGFQTLINYRGPRGNFSTLSVEQVLDGQMPAQWGRDRIILVGPMAESLRDTFYTPYSVQLMQLTKPTPGVEIHANLTSQLLSSALNQRPLFKTWSELGEMLWIAGWAIVGALLVWQQRSLQASQTLASLHSPLSQAWQSLKIPVSLVVMAAGLVVGTYGAFTLGWWIPVAPALLSLGWSAIVVTGYLAQTAAEMRKTLGRYLTDEVVASLLETPEGLTLVGEKRKVTTLMSDIRGFTSLSEQLPPEQVVKLLNLYLGFMTKIIQRYGGTINDLTGDGIVVFFGAPIQRPDDGERAVACALAMQLAMDAVNQQSQTLNLPPLQMGIGVNTGEVVVGNIGSEEHTKYTAIGSHVNVAARIESFTVGGQILISESTWAEVQAIATLNGQSQAQMKGVSAPVTLYEVSGLAGPYNLKLREEQESFIELKHPLPLQYAVLEGKHLSEEQFWGKLVRLSANGAEILCDHRPAPLTNLKLLLWFPKTNDRRRDDRRADDRRAEDHHRQLPDDQPDRRVANRRADDRKTDDHRSDDQPVSSAMVESAMEIPSAAIVVEGMGEPQEIYAKVIQKPNGSEVGFYLRFTRVPPTAETLLQALRSDRRARKYPSEAAAIPISSDPTTSAPSA